MGEVASAKVLDGLPEPVRQRIEELVRALAGALGEDLEAVLVYGSAVRGGYQPGQSDVDLLVVLRDDAPAKLSAIGPAIELARFAARIETMLLVGAEIPRAADVFPLLYDDVRSCHAVLHGRDPFASLHIAEAHRRLRIEQELRESRIRLRRMVVEATQSQGALVGPIRRKLKQLRSPLHALLRLRGDAVPDGFEPVLRAAAAAYGIDPAPLFRVGEAPEAACEALGKLLDAAIDDVDRRDGGAS